MSFTLANHYVLSGKGIDAVIGTGVLGGPEGVSLTVEGKDIPGASFTEVANQGLAVTVLVYDGIYQTGITLVFPEVRLSEPVITFPAYAVLATSLNSGAGPEIAGPSHSYEIRPLVGSASDVLA